MKWRVMVVVCLAVAMARAPSAGANDWEGDDLEQIPSCGTMTVSHELWQYGRGRLVVEGYAQSRRNMDGCFSKMRIEAWVEGLTMHTVVNQGYGIAVSVSWIVNVPHYGVWNSISKHWLINFGGWLWGGWAHGSTEVTRSENETVSECSNESPCTAPGGGGPESGSPLILDTGGDGFTLTSSEDGVLFDLDGDGTLERVAWTEAGEDDEWLAFDRNGNGRIDDGTELFGNNTPAYPDQRERLSKNGFEALKFLEGPDFGRSNGDMILDARDGVFGQLLLWNDANHNGISEPEELRTAASAGVISLSTDYKEVGKRDRHGNQFKQRAPGTWSTSPHKRHVYDVWLKIQR